MVAICILWIGPGYQHLLEAGAARGDRQAAPFAGFGGVFGWVYALTFAFFYGPYPVLMLVMFTRPRIREAMTA
jgi:hypothetical protein